MRDGPARAIRADWRRGGFTSGVGDGRRNGRRTGISTHTIRALTNFGGAPALERVRLVVGRGVAGGEAGGADAGAVGVRFGFRILTRLMEAVRDRRGAMAIDALTFSVGLVCLFPRRGVRAGKGAGGGGGGADVDANACAAGGEDGAAVEDAGAVGDEGIGLEITWVAVEALVPAAVGRAVDFGRECMGLFKALALSTLNGRNFDSIS